MADDLYERNDDQTITGTDFATIYGNRQKTNAMLNKAKILFAEPGQTNTTSDNMERGGALWRGSVTYKAGDIVVYNNLIYIALEDNTNLIPVSNITKWRLFAEGSTITQTPERGGLLWSSTINYQLGDIVVYGSDIYLSTAPSLNTIPTDPSKWVFFDPTTNHIPDATNKAGYELISGGINSLDIKWGPFRMTPNELNNDFIMPNGTSAIVISPIISDGVTITIPDGSTLIIL